MTSALPKENSMTQYPKYFITTIASVLLLAIFLFLASSLLVSQPIGFTVRNYFYGIASSQNFDLASSFNDSVVDRVETEGQRDSTELDRNGTNDGKDGSLKSDGEGDGKKDVVLKEIQIPDVDSPNVDKSVNSPSNVTSGDSTTTTNVNYESNVPSSYGIVNNASLSEDTEKRDTDSTDSDCDLYHGKWVYDSAGPLYTNNSCPVLSQMQNCQGNGRPDKDYENWRWKPNQCDLPRFDPRKFLELMRGKTLAYIGDSVSRNQMESMLCILWQAEEPQDRGTKKMRRYFFNSTSTTIVRIWSSWLVHQTTEPFDYAPANVTKLHLDAPDEGFMEYIKEFHVIVFSSGHWFVKPSVYILNNEIVGGQLWWPDKSKKMEVNNIEAFGISVETIFSSMVTNANYSGLTIVRSYSPDHYEGGAWNTGGSCTGKDKPATDSELVENEFTNIMHEKQVTGFNRAIKKQTNKSILKYMDITNVFSYRRDGHPGPYRNTDPNKITKRGPDGRPPPQDCLHWCMPGPIDTWNEIVFEIIQQEFKHKEASS